MYGKNIFCYGKKEICLLRWGKTHAMFILHYVAYAVVCMGCNNYFVVMYNRSPSCFASPTTKHDCQVAKLGHMPNPSLSRNLLNITILFYFNIPCIFLPLGFCHESHLFENPTFWQ